MPRHYDDAEEHHATAAIAAQRDAAWTEIARLRQGIQQAIAVTISPSPGGQQVTPRLEQAPSVRRFARDYLEPLLEEVPVFQRPAQP